MAVQPRPQLPVLDPWMRNILIGLFVLYVAELVLLNLGTTTNALVGSLSWRSFAVGFAPWQPVTHFLVQGRDAVINVLISLLVLYFFLPAMPGILPLRRQLAQAVGASAVGAMILPLALDATGLLPASGATGWSVLVTALIVLFGLGMPGAVVNLFFILPIPASFFVWGTLILAGLFFLVNPGIGTAEPIGAWLGVYLWWMYAGPGRRRRQLQANAEKIEAELRRFTVIDGGRSSQGPQGGQDDDWVH